MNAFCSGDKGGATGAAGFSAGAFVCAGLNGAVAVSIKPTKNPVRKFIFGVNLCKSFDMRVVITTRGAERKLDGTGLILKIVNPPYQTVVVRT